MLQMTIPDATAVIALVFSLYGTAVSTILLIIELKKSKRRISVSPSITTFAVESTQQDIWVIELKAVNTGQRPVIVEAAGIALSASKLLAPPPLLSRHQKVF
jgi:hypothetical protein